MSTAVDTGPNLRTRSEVVYKGTQGRKWRTAIVWKIYRVGAGRSVKILYTRNGKYFVDVDVLVETVKPRELLKTEEVEERILHWVALLQELNLRLSKDKNPSDDLTLDHVPLYLYMQQENYKANQISKGTLRLGTFNIKHFGAKQNP